jgi:predicted neutral ceramidase superfamily lipid hydrolase
MAVKRDDGLENRLGFFSRQLPSSKWLFAILSLFSIGIGISSVALMDYPLLGRLLPDVLIKGAFAGLLLFMMPTLITVLTIKLLKRIARIKHVIAFAMVANGIYGIFFALGGAVYAVTSSQALFVLVSLLGDASVFAWWFMVSKIALGRRKSASLYALLQPSINLLLFAPTSGFLLNFSIPVNVLLIKLYASIAIFIAISYLILFIFDNPIKKGIGIDGIAFFSQMVQSWLFNIDATFEGSKTGRFGTRQDIDADTVVVKNLDGRTKGIIFSPWVHYGPAGTIGGSNFPYVLERHIWKKYGVPGVIMHPTLNEDMNPLLDTQISELRSALDSSVHENTLVKGKGALHSEGSCNGARVSCISVGNLCFTTLSRAPKVTEDVAPEAGMLLKRLLEHDGKQHMLIDAHNSRYETASKKELMGVQPDGTYMKDYVEAIKSLKVRHRSRHQKIGFGFSNPYNELGSPKDLAPGNINVVLFKYNGFRHAMVMFNANNMMPSMRNGIIDHIKRKYSISAEVYTTDTHFVNALDRTASNVLGRYTDIERLLPFVDKAVETAVLNTEAVRIYHSRKVIRNFAIWGANVREKMNAVVGSVFMLARVVVPLLIVIGFVIAAWLITIV